MSSIDTTKATNQDAPARQRRNNKIFNGAAAAGLLGLLGLTASQVPYEQLNGRDLGQMISKQVEDVDFYQNWSVNKFFKDEEKTLNILTRETTDLFELVKKHQAKLNELGINFNPDQNDSFKDFFKEMTEETPVTKDLEELIRKNYPESYTSEEAITRLKGNHKKMFLGALLDFLENKPITFTNEQRPQLIECAKESIKLGLKGSYTGDQIKLLKQRIIPYLQDGKECNSIFWDNLKPEDIGDLDKLGNLALTAKKLSFVLEKIDAN
jgi:hypothetical protein